LNSHTLKIDQEARGSQCLTLGTGSMVSLTAPSRAGCRCPTLTAGTDKVGVVADDAPLTPGTEAWWRAVLTDPTQHFEPLRNVFLRLPSPPHGKLCGAPFKGPGSLVLGPIGFRP
jgi:hypothetical protein